jgi:hypothetical protein
MIGQWPTANAQQLPKESVGQAILYCAKITKKNCETKKKGKKTEKGSHYWWGHMDAGDQAEELLSRHTWWASEAV